VPRTILDKRRLPHEKLVKLIWGELGPRGYTPVELAEIMGVTPNTARKRMREPGDFTLDELLKICRGLDIPLDALRAAITY